ncbi:hypothetical protein [Streptomyces sp. NPDC058674]|uniref:hypothetical protein n=1 Tax=Streptomyces sp. NPDC058674 TaxID=3346592 RepID=UPI00365A458C
MNIGLTLAGLGISLVILYANARTWWKAGKDPKTLGPFGAGFTLGALATVCTGGLLGFLAGCTVQATNGTGARVVPGSTGTPSQPLAQGSLGQLTPEGGLVVFLLAAGVTLAWRAAGKDVKKRMAGGLLCGACLCATAGFASLLDGLPQAANGIGMAIRLAAEGQGVL